MPVILIVSDSRRDDTPVQARLRAEGYHTLSVNDAASALDTLNCIRADVLVVDMASIDKRTIALLERLRDHREYKEMPVFFVGARGGRRGR